MRVTIAALGFELDLTFGPTTETAAVDGASLDGGTTSAYPMGFVVRHEVPDEVAIVRPVSPWEDDSES